MPRPNRSFSCAYCQTLYATTNWPKQRFCSKRCAGIVREGTPRERLMANVIRAAAEDACWGWAGRVLPGPRPYGSLKVDGRETLAHRLMWEVTHGPIAGDLLVLHRCDNPPCCNPAHLFLGTKKDNAQDALMKGRLFISAGERSGNAKLTADQVRAIRALDPNESAATVAARYGVSPALIYLIRQRRAWRHIL